MGQGFASGSSSNSCGCNGLLLAVSVHIKAYGAGDKEAREEESFEEGGLQDDAEKDFLANIALTRQEVRHLGSAPFQGWLDGLVKRARRPMRPPPGGGEPEHCVVYKLVLGDFNLAAPGSNLLGFGQSVDPGSAWDALLDTCGFKLALHNEATNLVLPLVFGRPFPYDNACYRCECLCAEGGACVAVRGSHGVSARVCEDAAHVELGEVGALLEAKARLGLSSAFARQAFGKDLERYCQQKLYVAWSDHKPICVELLTTGS